MLGSGIKRVLLLDFGGVCLLNPVELHYRLHARLGLSPGTFDWRGPLDPSTDELWRAMAEGDGITEREYWEIRANEVGEVIGQPMTTSDLMELLYVPATEAMIRPGCRRAVAAAQRAGWRVAVFSNDLFSFHGPEWAMQIPLLQSVERVIDCSDGPAFKPDRRAYQWALSLLDADAQEVLFVDDQPVNVNGARACGIESICFDVGRAEQCWAEITERITVAQ